MEHGALGVSQELEAAASAVGIRDAIDALAARTLVWEDAVQLVDANQRSRVSKFQPCLPPATEQGLIARETMNVHDANATLLAWRERRHTADGAETA